MNKDFPPKLDKLIVTLCITARPLYMSTCLILSETVVMNIYIRVIFIKRQSL